MKEQLINTIKRHKILVLTLLAGALGALFFITIYGIKVLYVTNDCWLHNSGDLTQHYYGWVFFRNSEWNFPLGMFNGLSYPYNESIIFTDSIPLFAIFFKCMSWALPKTFQYFGLFGILCYTLQGIFAFTLLRKFINNKTIAIIRHSIFYSITIYDTKNVWTYSTCCKFSNTCGILHMGI